MTIERFCYRINGLVVESEFFLDEAETCRARTVDVRISRSRVAKISGADRSFRTYRITQRGDVLEYAGIGRFLVSAGSQIDFDPEPDFDLRWLGIPLLGPVFALLLHRRRNFVLHGSAVEIDGEAHVFLGDKGAGKSTTAAVLIASGYRLIADDVVALERARNGLFVQPGYPAMKIERGMLDRFAVNDYRIIEPDDGSYTAGKTRIRLVGPTLRGPIPLGPIHCLERGPTNDLTALAGQEALRALIRFSYYPRFGEAALSASETAALFAAAAELMPLAKIDSLTVKNDLGKITAIVPFLAEKHALYSFTG